MNKIKHILSCIIIALIFIFVAFVTYNIVEPKAYDFMTKQVLIQKLPFDKYKKVHGSDDIVLVIIDSDTVKKYRWPWKRDYDAKVIKYFTEYAKPKLIVSDFILTNLDINYPEADRTYFNTISSVENLIEGFMPNMLDWKDKNVGDKYLKYFKKYSIEVENKSKNKFIIYKSMLTSPQAYLNSIKNLGHVYIPTGPINRNFSNWSFDNIIRTNEYILRYPTAYYPSLAFKSYLILKNPKNIEIRDKAIIVDDQKINLLNSTHIYNGINKVNLEAYANPIKFYKIHNETGYSHIKYSVIDVMDSYEALKQGKKPKLDPLIFKDKIVVLGANVPAGAGLNDNKNSPIAVNHPGVDLQATVLENIVHNDFLTVIPQWFNILVTLLGMFFVYGVIRVFDLYKSVTCILSMISVYCAISTVLFYFDIVISLITPIIMFVMTTILAYVHKFILENKSKEKVKSAMGKYMSQDIMKRVIQNIDNLGLGGKKAIVTVLFSDIRGFTTMSEQMSAQEVSEILNEYFTEMEPIITKYNGVINKFIGDAVMAIFGEPIQDKNHAKNAVKCAYEMIQKVKELQKKWVNEGKPKIDIGIGINTGEVFVGNIGSVNRMEYTVIGDTVNLASRLESYNKIYKTKMLISSSTYEEVKGFTDVIKISDVQIRGKANKMDIYEVLKVL